MDIMRTSSNMRTVKTSRVKNRSAAEVQITAEQLVLEAQDRAHAEKPPPPKQHITDPAELAEHRTRVRKEFEERAMINRRAMRVWLQYASWEEQQREIERARSIYERALDGDPRSIPVWMRYAEMEMRCKFIARARNVWDRAVTLLPRVDAFWYKYTYMEEILGNVAGARVVFERWMAWEPPDQAWLSYIKLEVRAGQTERARGVYERYIACHPSQTSYMRYAKWEERNGQLALARRVYERSTAELRENEKDQELYMAFGRFEVKCGELERARAIFRHGLETLPKAKAETLYTEYTAFEKQHGDRKDIEDVIVGKRRLQYEEAVKENPLNYDAWFDYIRLEEGERAHARIREVYERAVGNIPPVAEKRFWRRYVYLWINYAVWEELEAGDVARARAVYAALLKIIPHETFTFGKAWLLAAQFEVRQRNLAAARKTLGTCIGRCPKQKVVHGYIALELQLGEIERCRKLHEKFLSLWPADVSGWTKFAELERSMSEDERARALYDLAISQPVLDVPEAAWKAYIDFEIEKTEYDRVRHLYEQLLGRTQHVKVWMSYAAFEASIVGDAGAARDIYSRAYVHFKGLGDDGKESRVVLIETWHAFERGMLEDAVAAGAETDVYEASLKEVEAKLPRVVVKRRPLFSRDGAPLGSEEYQDYVFPDDESKPPTLKLLELADQWKAGGGSLAALLGLTGGGADGAAEEEERASDAQAAGDAGDAPSLAGVKRSAFAAFGYDDGDDDAAAAAPRRRERLEHVDASSAAAATPLPVDEAVAAEKLHEERAHTSTTERDLYCEEDAGEKADRDV